MSSLTELLQREPHQKVLRALQVFCVSMNRFCQRKQSPSYTICSDGSWQLQGLSRSNQPMSSKRCDWTSNVERHPFTKKPTDSWFYYLSKRWPNLTLTVINRNEREGHPVAIWKPIKRHVWLFKCVFRAVFWTSCCWYYWKQVFYVLLDNTHWYPTLTFCRSPSWVKMYIKQVDRNTLTMVLK